MRFNTLVLTFLIGAATAAAATLDHDYLFQNTLADSLGGPSLVSLGGTVGSNGYTFAADQGLSLSNAVTNSADYSIYLDFEFDALSGYRKIVDFENLGSDDGLYNLSTALNYYNLSTGPAAAFTAGVFAPVVITRDAATNTVTGYVNGVQELQFTDTSSDAVFSSPNNIINFFGDDTVTGGRESSSGEVSEIRIYDGALTAAEVAALPTGSAPEPMSMALAGACLSLCVLLRRRGYSIR